ncbi:MAG: hypothetical protein AAB535_03070 [Patescibacteria group bacterium]
MSLTKNDLGAIKVLIQETFDQKITEKGLATKKDLKELSTKKDLQKIDKKFDKLIGFLDKDYLRVKQDVREIQSHLHLPVSDF